MKAMKAIHGAKPLFHNHKEFQFKCVIFIFKLEEQGIIQSMCRVARAIDNEPIKGFGE